MTLDIYKNTVLPIPAGRCFCFNMYHLVEFGVCKETHPIFAIVRNLVL